ncbi:hypothetical protein R1flu_009226 [Riccia fluitans]|uniref:Reverse transcriptase zinc-binding domain-containing protein n=1 Tax=Riccia fluitans TaxID=41844 RepID=A0ABD1Z1G5_9MARC
MRYVGRLLSGESSDWAHMIRFFVREQMLKRSYCWVVKHWTAEEGLLLLPKFSTPRSETTNSIVHSWFKYRKYLKLDEDALVLPGSLTLRQILELLKRYRMDQGCGSGKNPWGISKPHADRCNHRIPRVAANCANRHSEAGTQPKLEVAELRNRVEEGLEANFWHKLEESEEATEDLSAKWPPGTYTLTWSSRWRKLWDRGGLPRVKIWLWKLLQRAFFTGKRATTMQVSYDPCCRCKAATESVSHLFYECSTSRTRWNQLRELAIESRASFHVAYSLLELIDKAIRTKKAVAH